MKLKFAIREGKAFPAGCHSLVNYRQCHQLSTSGSERGHYTPGQVVSYFLVICATLCLAFGPSVIASSTDESKSWVAAWQGSPTLGGTFDSSGCPSDVGLNNQTIRNIVYITAGGHSVRARISNAAGSDPLKVGAASIGISAGGAATVPGSLHRLHFGGKNSIVVAAGGEVLSDPVRLTVRALQTLSVSLYLPNNTGLATQHYFPQQTNYLAVGDQTASEGGGFNQPISCWMFLSGVDVQANPRVLGALITLGDSITDGWNSTIDGNARYPDWLARRLVRRKEATLSVSNAGISGNALLSNAYPDLPQLGHFGARPHRSGCTHAARCSCGNPARRNQRYRR